MTNEKKCLRKILEIRVSCFSIDRKSLSIDRTSQRVEIEFFNFFDRSRGTLDQSKERKLEFFSKCFHMYKEQCNV